MIVALQGDYGKPRPALVVQSDVAQHLPSIIVCPVTTDLRPDSAHVRLTVYPTPGNGLREISQVMIDKTSAIPRSRVGATIGTADENLIGTATRALAILLGIV